MIVREAQCRALSLYEPSIAFQWQGKMRIDYVHVEWCC